MASFKDTFAKARASGKKTFTWNGKLYNTKYKEEVAASGPTRPVAKPDTPARIAADTTAALSQTAKPSAAQSVMDTLTARNVAVPSAPSKTAGAKPAAKPVVKAGGGLFDWLKLPSARDVAVPAQSAKKPKK